MSALSQGRMRHLSSPCLWMSLYLRWYPGHQRLICREPSISIYIPTAWGLPCSMEQGRAQGISQAAP